MSLDADFEQLGAAASQLYLMALNGVVCDPTDPCQYCAPVWKKLTDVLDRYDPEWGRMGRSFSLKGGAAVSVGGGGEEK
jgi:hypothetical protein